MTGAIIPDEHIMIMTSMMNPTKTIIKLGLQGPLQAPCSAPHGCFKFKFNCTLRPLRRSTAQKRSSYIHTNGISFY
jgi:hypothetical protein